jgi:hypothetical protein
MVKLARIILAYVFSQYTIYNDVIEEYFKQVDTLLVEIDLTPEVYEILASTSKLDTVASQIQRNNDFMKEYKRDRPYLQMKKIGLDKFKSHFVYKDIGTYYDFDQQRLINVDDNETERVLKACNANSRMQESLLYTYLEQTGPGQLPQKKSDDHITGNKMPTSVPSKITSGYGSGSMAGGTTSSFGQAPGPLVSHITDLHSLLNMDAQLPQEVESLAKSRFESRLGSDFRKRNKSRTGPAPEIKILAKVREDQPG